VRAFPIGRKSVRPEGPAESVAAYPLEHDYSIVQRTSVLYSNYRCGTNFVKSVLSRVSEVHQVDELFAREEAGGGEDFAFSKYIRGKKPDVSELLLSPERGLRRYLNYIYADVPDSGAVLFDVKYEHAYRLGVDGQDQTPIVLTQFRHLDLPIIHLIRRDAIAQALSHLVASRTGVYMNLRGSAAGGAQDSERYWFDPAEVLRLARGRIYIHEQARTQLQLLGARTITAYYEDLTGPRWREQFQRLCRFLDIYVEIPNDFVPDTVNQRSGERVANRDEILDYVQDNAPELVHTYAA